MAKKLFDVVKSLNTANILISMLITIFAIGAVIMPTSKYFENINSIALFKWLKETPFKANWWLYLSIFVIAFLTLNTILCSIESVIKKYSNTSFTAAIAPQIIHVGFGFALVAHLVSASGSHQEMIYLYKSHPITLESGTKLFLDNINYINTGFIPDVQVDISYLFSSRELKERTISPNNPSFEEENGMGIYLKRAIPSPYPMVILELRNEPGGIWALFGAILFLIGTVLLFGTKIKSKQ